jgi:hypothetical protein
MGTTIRPIPDRFCQGRAGIVAAVPTTFADLESEAPAIATFVRERIDATGLCLLGTLRSDGSPRVSGSELWLHDGHVYIGSMLHAMKAKDLQRDARCCFITPLADKDDMSGEAKVFCTAREITDPAEWDAARRAFEAERGMDPLGEPGGAHLFELHVEGAAWTRVEGGDALRISSWRADGGVRERVRRGTGGEAEDL